MIAKKPTLTEWGPLAMKREWERLNDEVNEMYARHASVIAVDLPDRMPVQGAKREAYAAAANSIGALVSTWARVEQAQWMSTQALRFLFHALPMLSTGLGNPKSPTSVDPLLDENRDLSAIPAAKPNQPGEPRGVPGHGLDLDGKRRGLAHEATLKLDAYGLEVERYDEEHARHQSRIRTALLVLNGNRGDPFDVETTKPALPEGPPPLNITFAEEK